ncbi:MAG: winged helix-turn-helix transcriptional regulator [Acidimicrobiales bacterium]|nr:winged helix-turn-helix transcriptional regulator [Acidimicrobiales bacterium]MBO0893855.1 winged helix-turn-helix transcriptional regulator [Acidimicrobiales bacterium]
MPDGSTSTEASDPPLDISQTPFGQAVGFLISQLGFEVTRRFALIMNDVDLEPRQWTLLRAVADAEGQSQNALGDALSIPPSSMVALVDHLEDRGLLKRRPDPADRRSRKLYITPKGTRAIENAWELAAGFERTLCAGFTTNQRQQLIELLSRVVDNLGLAQGVHPGVAPSR